MVSKSKRQYVDDYAHFRFALEGNRHISQTQAAEMLIVVLRTLSLLTMAILVEVSACS